MSARGFLFAGDLYVNRYSGGVLQGEEGPFEGSVLSIQPNVDTKEMMSKGRTTYGQVLESVTLAKPSDFSVTFNEGTATTLALALMGTVSVLNQASAAATDYTVTAKQGKWVPLPKANFTGTVTVKDAATSLITYVLGTDYDFNAQLGTIKALAGGAITEGESIKVNGAVSSIAGSLIDGGTTPDLRIALRMHGKNMADGLPVVVTVDEAIVAPSAAVDFLASDFVGMPMKGRMKTQAGKSSAFRVELRSA